LPAKPAKQLVKSC